MFFYGQKTKLKPNLKFSHLVLMGIGGALGAGFFVLISEAITLAGTLIPLSFLVASIVAFLMSRIYAELATSIPIAGGGQAYLENAFSSNPLLFVVHWLIWFGIMAFTALNALGVGFYLSLLLPVNPIVIALIGVAIIVLVNLKGVENVGKLQIFVGCFMFLGLTVLVVLLSNHLPSEIILLNESNSTSPFGWLYAIPLVFVIFIGTEDIATLAEEVKDKRSLSKAFTTIILGILIITVLLSFMFSQIFTKDQLQNNPQPFQLLGSVIGNSGQILGISVAILGCISSFFISSLAGARLAYAMGKSGEFPKVFTKLNKHKVPYIAVFASLAIVTLLVLTGSAKYAAYLSSVGFFIEMIALSFAMIKLRKKRPRLPRPILVKPYPLIPILVICISIFFLFFVELEAWLVVLGFALMGFVVNIAKHVKKEKWILALIGIVAFLFIVTMVTALIVLL